MNGWLLATASVLALVALDRALAYFDLKQEHEALSNEHEDALDQLTYVITKNERLTAEMNETRNATSAALVAIAPLVVKTDWMTGRWGGQFQTLVKMENERNRKVTAVRKIFMENPVVKHLVRTDAQMLMPDVKGLPL